MKSIFGLLLVILTNTVAWPQDIKAFQIYSQTGKKVDFGLMVTTLSKYDVVLFGEYHNNSINHWLELQLTKALYQQKKERLILGAEMIERDDQPLLNRYFSDTIDASTFEDTARLWNNYKTDYKPLVDFAKKHHLRFIATNIPRKYAAIVAREGLAALDSLNDPEKAYIARLPITVDTTIPGYAEMRVLMKSHAGHNIDNFIAAQAVKDATMAESILQNTEKKTLFLHFNGNYHSKAYGGIYWYLKQNRPKLKIAVISIFENKEPSLRLPADATLTEFNFVLPSDMTKTY